MNDVNNIEIIKKQMGGGMLDVMIGVRHWLRDGDTALQFRFAAKAANKANVARITLCDDDTYRMEFFRVRGVKIDLISCIDGLFADNLMHAFESATKLATHL